MRPTDRREFEQLLLARRGDVEASLAVTSRELDGIRAARADATADDEHDPEGSTLSTDWSRIVGLGADAAAHLTAIDRALVRLESGDYGVCVTCGRDIPPARLRARPTADQCVASASARDLHNADV